MKTEEYEYEKMKAAQISKPGGEFELVERDIPEPGARQVRVKVEACGICHSDLLVKEGLWPGIQCPRVPGHEIAGALMQSALMSWNGKKDNVWALAGMADIVLSAINAGAVISRCALTERLPESISTAVMPST